MLARSTFSFFSIDPSEVHMFSDAQINFYVDNCKDHSAYLYFDATGSIIKKIPHQDQQILLYSLLMQNPVSGRSAIPVAEMVSNNQHATEIRHFLDRWIEKVKSGSSSFMPRHIETDLSWALIQAVTGAFNKQDLHMWTWDVLHKKCTSKQIKSKVYIHVCTSHMMQTFLRSMKSVSVSKCLSLIITSCSTDHALHIFTLICKSFGSPYLTETTKNAIAALRKEVDNVNDEIPDQDSSFTTDESSTASEKIKQSKFYTMFSTKWNNIKDTFSSDGEVNPLMAQNFIEIFINKYSGLFPL